MDTFHVVNFLFDLLFTVKPVIIASSTDDTTHYTCAKEIKLILENLETAKTEILKWFIDNAIKANREKLLQQRRLSAAP